MKSFAVNVNGFKAIVMAPSSIDAIFIHAANLGVDPIRASSRLASQQP